MEPVERIELPTFALQKHCSTPELHRPLEFLLTFFLCLTLL